MNLKTVQTFLEEFGITKHKDIAVEFRTSTIFDPDEDEFSWVYGLVGGLKNNNFDFRIFCGDVLLTASFELDSLDEFTGYDAGSFRQFDIDFSLQGRKLSITKLITDKDDLNLLFTTIFATVGKYGSTLSAKIERSKKTGKTLTDEETKEFARSLVRLEMTESKQAVVSAMKTAKVLLLAQGFHEDWVETKFIPTFGSALEQYLPELYK